MPLIVCEVGEDGSTVFRVSDTRTSTRSSGSSSLGSSPSKKRKSTEPMELEEHFRASTSTEAAKKWEHISESERGLVMSIMNSKIDLIQPQTRERVKTLFIQLDTNKSGILTVEDFKGVNPDLDEKLQAIWQGLRINFDFDNNSVITQQEFLAYFILEGFMAPGNPSEHYQMTHTQTVGMQLMTFVMNLDFALNAVLQKVEDGLNDLFKK